MTSLIETPPFDPLTGVAPEKHWIVGGRSVWCWTINLDQARSEFDAARARVTSGELRRFNQLRPENPFQLRVATRARLRSILGSCLNQEPLLINFEVTKPGRPFVPQATANSWDFSLSYSPELAIIGLVQGGRIGADIQAIPDEAPSPELLSLALTRREWLLYDAALIEDRSRLFTSWWVQKEALFKAGRCGEEFRPGEIESLLGHPSQDECRESDISLWEMRPGVLASCSVGFSPA